MKTSVLWLAHLGTNEGLVRPEQCLALQRSLGETVGLAEFAQALIDEGYVDEIEKLEMLAGLAHTRGAKGPPPEHPFLEQVLEEIADTFAQPTAEYTGRPEFPFEAMGRMSDSAVQESLRHLLKSAGQYGASDLHLCAGSRPFVRKDRAFEFISSHPLSRMEAERLNQALLTSPQRKLFLEKHDLDFALAITPRHRFRVNLMEHRLGPSGSYRIVPETPQSMLALGFGPHESTLLRMLSHHNGLVLITGPAGAGKTQTLAAMVDYLNANRTDHIITVEDPIEVVQPSKRCNVTQREVGPHTRSFGSALKGALREDPDVIVIGELRDLAAIEMAISASETGHLVIGTMHTSDAATTLNRLLDVFPAAQQPQIRASVAESLRGIVCQRLLPAARGGLVLACEILVNNAAIASLIREGKTTGLRNTMETSVRDGMCLMDNVVLQLFQQGRIAPETALGCITNRVLRARIRS